MLYGFTKRALNFSPTNENWSTSCRLRGRFLFHLLVEVAYCFTKLPWNMPSTNKNSFQVDPWGTNFSIHLSKIVEWFHQEGLKSPLLMKIAQLDVLWLGIFLYFLVKILWVKMLYDSNERSWTLTPTNGKWPTFCPLRVRFWYFLVNCIVLLWYLKSEPNSENFQQFPHGADFSSF